MMRKKKKIKIEEEEDILQQETEEEYDLPAWHRVGCFTCVTSAILLQQIVDWIMLVIISRSIAVSTDSWRQEGEGSRGNGVTG